MEDEDVEHAEPWRKYTKKRLPRGFAHPLGQQDVRSALLTTDVAVDWLSLSDCDESAWRDLSPVRLLSVSRVGDAVRRGCGDGRSAIRPIYR